jgi:hypothetical protein
MAVMTYMFYGRMFTERDNAEKPAECMYVLKKGDNAGWPYIYYDPELKKKMVAPEYGGDGKTEGSKEYIDPVMAFPCAHGAGWHCCFIQAICFLRNIRTALSSRSMVHGTARLCRRKVIMLYLFLLKMANQPANGKCLQTALVEWNQV